MKTKPLRFARRIYSGRGALMDDLLGEVAERPELVRLVHYGRQLDEQQIDMLIRLLVRSFNGNNGNGQAH